MDLHWLIGPSPSRANVLWEMISFWGLGKRGFTVGGMGDGGLGKRVFVYIPVKRREYEKGWSFIGGKSLSRAKWIGRLRPRLAVE